MVRAAVKRMEGNARRGAPRLSGVSARKGGLSAAIEAGVEEVILYLQSRHSPERVARRYMHIREQELLLLLIFDVFGL